MSDCIKIKKVKSGDNIAFVVPAMYINQNGEQIAIPSPYGKESITFDTLDKAEEAVHYAGYTSTLEENKPTIKKSSLAQHKTDYSEVIDLFLKNLGDENLNIRTTSINALSSFGSAVYEKIIEELENENWLIRQSAIMCIEKIAEKNKVEADIFIKPLMQAAADTNSMVKGAALSALAKICNNEQ